MTGGSPFEQQLQSETIGTERLRARILSALFLAVALMFLLLTGLLPEQYDAIFGLEGVRWQLVGLLFAVSLYELLLQMGLGFLMWRGRSIPGPVRFVNATVEITVPSLGIIILAEVLPPVLTLVSPFVALYFIFVILSILRLDFVLSLFTGAMASVQYLVLSLLFLEYHGEQAGSPMLAANAIYIARAVMLVGAGAAAGLIARLIRRKIVSSVHSVEERNQAIDLFGQQVSEPVARELLQNAHHATGRMRMVTVMFLDIRDFTPFAERHAPEEVVTFLNTMFAELIRIVNEHRGIVNQFLGDGFMTTFGAPLEDTGHAAHAIAAAREMHATVERLSAEGGIPPTRIGIGIHSGPALTGNIGSEERRQYSVTGTTVILASRIEQLNKRFHSSILCSGATLEHAGIPPESAEALGPMQMKGTIAPVEVYRLA